MTPLAFEPLSDEELDELDHFMLREVNCDEAMTLDILDGYLHAIAIGPKNRMPRHWMPNIWGKGESMMPPVESIDKLNRILGLIMRMFNSIITGLEEDPPEIYPQWCAQEYRGRDHHSMGSAVELEGNRNFLGHPVIQPPGCNRHARAKPYVSCTRIRAVLSPVKAAANGCRTTADGQPS